MKILATTFVLIAWALLAPAMLPAAPPSACPKLTADYTIFSGPTTRGTQLFSAPVFYHTEYFIVNRTSKPIQVGLSQSTRGLQATADIHEVGRRDTLRGGEYMSEDAFGEWAQRIHFQLTARNPKWLQGVAVNMEHPTVVAIDATHRRCYFFITKTKKPYY